MPATTMKQSTTGIAEKQHPSASSKDIPSGSAPASILVVEDESILALFLQRRLRTLGYETPEHAATGEEAIEKASRFQPDLILMDIRLRGPMDGITAVSRIQQQLDVPVVYLTAYGDQATMQRARETKQFGILSKPIDDETLREAIGAALRRHRPERGSS